MQDFRVFVWKIAFSSTLYENYYNRALIALLALFWE